MLAQRTDAFVWTDAVSVEASAWRLRVSLEHEQVIRRCLKTEFYVLVLRRCLKQLSRHLDELARQEHTADVDELRQVACRVESALLALRPTLGALRNRGVWWERFLVNRLVSLTEDLEDVNEALLLATDRECRDLLIQTAREVAQQSTTLPEHPSDWRDALERM